MESKRGASGPGYHDRELSIHAHQYIIDLDYRELYVLYKTLHDASGTSGRK
jgi:hypothetical protein